MNRLEEEEPAWLSSETVLAFHMEVSARYGGSSGIRDEGLLVSALGRPKNLLHYEQATLVELAAAYAAGIVKNHPFVDGNKRTGATAMAAFLYLNDVIVEADEIELVRVIEGLAAGLVPQSQLAQWLAKCTRKA